MLAASLMCDNPLSNEEIRHLNDPCNNVRQLGYDPEEYLFVMLSPVEKEYKKLCLYASKRVDNWRDANYDQTHYQCQSRKTDGPGPGPGPGPIQGYCLTEEFLNATFITRYCVGNLLGKMGVFRAPLIVVLTPRTHNGMDLLRRYITEVCRRFDQQLDEEKRIMVFDPTSGPPREILGRKLETIYLPMEQKRNVIATIENFLSEKSYKFHYEHGIPHKLVFLLYGLPGTGKTSLVKAIATHFGMTIMPLKMSAMDDLMLRSTTSQVPRDTIILLEDFDSAFTGMKDAATRNVEFNPFQATRLSYSGILDLLDGISTPERQLIFITCNNTDIINSPYMRAGRIDHLIKFGPMTFETAKSMLISYHPGEPEQSIDEVANKINGKLTPAELQTVILESQNFEQIHQRISSRIDDIRKRYSGLNESNQKMYQDYYQEQYRGFSANRMYT